MRYLTKTSIVLEKMIGKTPTTCKVSKVEYGEGSLTIYYAFRFGKSSPIRNEIKETLGSEEDPLDKAYDIIRQKFFNDELYEFKRIQKRLASSKPKEKETPLF